jgi:tryptophan synthase alpha chain
MSKRPVKTYSQVFSELRRAGRPALVSFFVIGDPDFDTSLSLVKAAVEAGSDILELGIPFSDPIADGPVIQRADIRAAGSGMSVDRALEFIRLVRGFTDAPIGLLMYYNLVYQRGVERFFGDCAAAGVNSVLVADLSIDDADEVTGAAGSSGLDTVFMVTPNTCDGRIGRIVSRSSGFIYAVSLLGVTGSRDKLSDLACGLLGRLKRATAVPICVGFGISSPEHAAAVAAAGADGVIIGSKLVGLIEANLGDGDRMRSEVGSFLMAVRAAIEPS